MKVRSSENGDYFEATVFDDEGGDMTRSYPAWFLELLVNKSIGYDMDAAKYKILQSGNDQVKTLNDGDFVVRDSAGLIYAYTPEEFKDRFVAVPLEETDGN